MRVTCPNCQAQFRITVEILAIANGKVRCGRCKEVFDAAEQLGRKKKIPEDVIRIRTVHDESPSTPSQDTSQATQENSETVDTISKVVKQQEAGQQEWFRFEAEKKEEHFNWFEKPAWKPEEPPAKEESKPEEPIDEVLQTAAEDLTPVYQEARKPLDLGEEKTEEKEADIPLVLIDDLSEQANPVKRHNLIWFMGTLLMATLLCLQYAWFNRDTLSQKIALRPYLEIMCEYARCELPLMNDLKRNVQTLQIVNSQIEPNPKDKQRLLAKVSITNTAPYAQTFPSIELRLTSFDEKILAMRRFKPEEYLADKKEIKNGIQAGQPLNIILDLVKPSHEVSGYHFELL